MDKRSLWMRKRTDVDIVYVVNSAPDGGDGLLQNVIVVGTEGAFLWTTIGGLSTFGPLALAEVPGAAEPLGATSAVGVAEG